ncbi:MULTISPECIES: helix-turn-helix domain-containing protein [Leptolyngbya]|jgi:two-component system NarL family response regulator|uniref:helix-turn-helix domain-containing protein n=1 Tax=Leptolyngbya TaxID=47251 RepID=UPI0008FC12B5|nr:MULTISPECIES: LuxR C-terminal-related transcriptional regulator [Leptolyngbya]MBD2371114.1 response regulator transcription factor [Leptolyngbya sp. FACHB-161]MBD2377582.1 response regulator transcription factor [Leptolyngbya sp. FACHB-238]MBD2402035.1 response regulator transcription factor [Leptolyngbya sp. FACHB-239]MBD2408554.1 response regulator transcription factor [Leptolyngbya sp. FACHB-402]BAS60458.1 Transcriptional regulator DegU2C LuxR family [Leptolyngbya boryana IAM M-101]
MNHSTGNDEGLCSSNGSAQLTVRECEVLQLIVAGKSNKEIASCLNLAERTVKSNISCILQKLCANNRAHAVAIAVKIGAIKI